MTEQRPADDRANAIPWPPILYVLMAAATYGLEALVPLDLPGAAALYWPGVVISVLGFAIGLAGAGYFKWIGNTVDPTSTAKALATGGMYQYTRNPMYLGACILFVGLGLAIPSVWLLVLVPFVAIGLEKLAILPEEAYLTRRFGDGYRAYCARVRRWL